MYQYCSICGSALHRKNKCPYRPKGKNRCSICGEKGHNKQRCSVGGVDGKVSYTKWESSYDKWSGDLWERLKATIKDMKLKSYTTTNRQNAWHVLLGHKCEYCHKYMDHTIKIDMGLGMKRIAKPCMMCPLMDLRACSNKIEEYHIIGRMYNAWTKGNKCLLTYSLS